MIFKKPEEGLAYSVPEFSVRGSLAATLPSVTSPKTEN